MIAMTEEWRPVVGFEGWYEVSSKGRVRSMPRTIIQKSVAGSVCAERRAGKMMKQHENNCGYLYVALSKQGKRKAYRVNRLIASAFFGPSDLWVNHKDMNRKNNHVENLEYCTPLYNRHYGDGIERTAAKLRKPFYGISPSGSKVTFNSMRHAASVIGTSTGFISDALHHARQHKTCKGWKLLEVTDDAD